MADKKITELTAATALDPTDLFVVVQNVSTTPVTKKITASIAVREKLLAVTTYYVRTDGSDSNTGLANTSGGAFLTIQKAIDVVAALDSSIYDVTIQIADGTYSGDLVGKNIGGAGKVIIQGNNGTPSNVVVAGTTTTFTFTNLSTTYEIKDLRITAGAAGACILATGNSYVRFGNLVFSTSLRALQALDGGFIESISNFTISASMTQAIIANNGTVRLLTSSTITISGTPVWTTSFVNVSRGGVFIGVGVTFSGSSTGPRYAVSGNGFIDTTGNITETYLPGDTIGTRTSGGQYNATGIFNSRVSSQFDKTNTTLAAITGLTATLLAGRTYRGRLILFTTSNVGGGVKIDFNGGSATITTFAAEAKIFQGGVLVAPGASRSAALNTTIANVTAVTVATIEVEFAITVNGAGTFIPEFACNAAVGTSSVLVLSTMIIEDITP